MTPGRTGQADCTFKPTKTNSDVVCACGAGVQKLQEFITLQLVVLYV
jgi:hypothetical protein